MSNLEIFITVVVIILLFLVIVTRGRIMVAILEAIANADWGSDSDSSDWD